VSNREGVTPADPERAAALQLVHQLREVTLRLELARTQFAQTTGLHPTDVRALIVLLDAERAGAGATPTWLSQQLGMTSQATTAVIHRLEAAGQVERRRSAADARSVQLMVSDSAVKLGWSFFGPLLERQIEVTGSLSPSERTTVSNFLAAIIAVT
jgi:DNA-binding MarR family transcriptional regulator